MMQIANIGEIFREYFKRGHVPSRIIEMGTYNEAFTQVLYNVRKEIDDNFDFITIDFIKYPTDMPEDIRARRYPKMVYIEMDLFHHIDIIGDVIKENTLVLCDNGDKIREMHLIAPYLKKDCVIMAHDYFESREEFTAIGGWPVCEITWNDVADLNMERYCYDIMKKGLWVSLIKRDK